MNFKTHRSRRRSRSRDQPTEADLAALEGRGVRRRGQPPQRRRARAAARARRPRGRRSRAWGSTTSTTGVGSAPLTEAGVARSASSSTTTPDGKVLVHCRKGGRAAALVLIHQALAHGWRPAEAVAKGRGDGAGGRRQPAGHGRELPRRPSPKAQRRLTTGPAEPARPATGHPSGRTVRSRADPGAEGRGRNGRSERGTGRIWAMSAPCLPLGSCILPRIRNPYIVSRAVRSRPSRIGR